MRISDWSSDVCSSDLFTQLTESYVDTVGAGGLLDWRYYPLEDYNHRESTSASSSLVGDLSVKYRLLDRFDVSVLGQYQQQRDRKSVVSGKSESVRVAIGGSGIIKKKKKNKKIV